MLNLYLFGAPRLLKNNKPIEFDTRKAIALLAYLAVTRAPHSRDALAALLYPEYDQTHARAALRRTLSTLNAALDSDTLDIDRENIGLQPHAKLTTDVVEFQIIVDEGKAKPSDVKRLTRAAEIYHDDFMAGFSLRDSPAFDDWQFFTTENLRREFARLLDKLVCYHRDQKSFDPAIQYARRWLALDPLHEPVHRQLMQLYAWSDQRAAALRQYDECVRVLEKELGVAPLDETTRLYEEIKANKIVDRGWWTVAGRANLTTDHSPLTTSRFPLVDRSTELETIQGAYAAVRTDGYLIAIEGEAGIGKTRLAEEFLGRIREQNAIILSGRSYEGETNLAFGIFVDALRMLIERKDLRAKIPSAWLDEVARLVPEIGDGATMPPLDNASARGRFFEGISQSMVAIPRNKIPGILFLDDLQWADSASLDLLTYIVQRLRGRPLCIVAAWRNENAGAIERLRAMIAPAHRANLATTISLSRLSPIAVTQLVASMVGESAVIAQKISTRLQQETEGLPFFVVEYLNALDQGNAEIIDWSLPNGVRDLLHARLAIASETGKQLLSTAAIIGRSFDFDTVREASGRTEEETIKTLEELNTQGLIKEIAAENLRYDFAHEKLRALAYAETSAARRRLLHRRVAEALVNRGRNRHETDALANQIARHYEYAGEQSLAADYFKLAGDYARALYANADALVHYHAALKLKNSEVSKTSEFSALHESIGDMQTLLGDYAGALSSYATAVALCEPSALARIEHKRGNVYHRRGEYALAESHYQLALNAIANDARAERSKLLVDWSLTAHALGDNERAQEMASRALALAESAGDLRSLAQVRNILGILARSRGDALQARYQLEQSCAIAETLNDPSARIAALNNLALVCRDSNETERAIKLTETALALCESIGDRHRQAALRNNLADLYHVTENIDASIANLEKAVRIFSEIGTEADAMQPEIWKLVEW